MRGRSNLESKIMSRHRIAREVEEQLHKNLKNEGFGGGEDSLTSNSTIRKAFYWVSSPISVILLLS